MTRWEACGRAIVADGVPKVMGIVNVTPDSFSDGGLAGTLEGAVAHALHLVAEGADLLDLGGESSRPGAEPVSLDEELRRVIPVVEALAPSGRGPDLGRHDQGRGRPPGPPGGRVDHQRHPRAGRRPGPGAPRGGGRRGGRADAHGRDAADHAGRPALRGRGARGPRRPGPPRSSAPRPRGSPATGSPSIRGSASARPSSTTWSSCGTSINLPTWDVPSWSAPRARGSWAP